ncbi:MAG: TlpA disulfide reductase family protein [Bacteroidales bacterium]|nr:TlpA disulfide reductase family protein [Bacteroidales bacterium]
MRKTIFLFGIIILASCTTQNHYKISGVVSDDKLEGSTVYLSKYIGRELLNVDSVKVKDGTFTFEGNQDTAMLRVLRMESDNIDKLPFILEEGEIYTTLDTLSSAEGTPLNDTLMAYQKAVAVLSNKYETIDSKIEELESSDSMQSVLTQELKAIESQMEQISVAFIHRNLNNVAGAYIYWQNRGTYTPELQKKILDQAGDLFKADPFVQIIASRLKMMKQVMIGMKFVDLTMNSPEGKPISLSDYAGKGKYILIDFWASWCPPCRKSIPHLAKIYSAYKGKGFEIVGVSFDKTKEDWQQGISELGITWPQMSDVKFWNSEGAKQYAVRAIPHTVLLDRGGVIVAKDLDPAALEMKLKELLK